jgi:hypothetical protein
MICAFFLFCSLVTAGDVPLDPGEVARFVRITSPTPSIVLLAHNYLDGAYFHQLEPGDMLRYYDEGWTDYRVTEIVDAKASDRFSTKTLLYIDGWLTPRQVHKKMFGDPDNLVLFTCSEAGRLFVVAERQ